MMSWRVRFLLIGSFSAFGLIGGIEGVVAQHAPASDEAPPRQNGETWEPLSDAALQALVAPYALYADNAIALVFDAAQYPATIRAAAELPDDARPAGWPESIEWLLAHPELLAQLNGDISATTLLGLAARNQLEDAWRAVDAVRQKMEAAAESNGAPADGPATDAAESGAADSAGGPTTTTVVPGVPYSTVVAATLWTEAVWEEIHAHYAYGGVAETTTTAGYGGPATGTVTTTTVTSPSGNASGTAATGAATITGPGGTTVAAQGQAVGGSATVGETTYYGATGSGTVSGSGGTSATASGQVTGSVTQSASTTSLQSDASVAVETSAGHEGLVARSGQTSATQNADGSVSVQQSAQGTLSGGQGSASYTHSSEATVTGSGGGSYQGGTTVETQQGSVTTSTTAGNGQVSTTVEGPGSSSTYSLGDRQVGGPSSSEGGAAKTSGDPLSVASSSPPSSAANSTDGGALSDRRSGSQFSRPQSVTGDVRYQQLGGALRAVPSQKAGAVGGGANAPSLARPESALSAPAASSFGRPSSLSKPNLGSAPAVAAPSVGSSRPSSHQVSPRSFSSPRSGRRGRR